MNESDYIAKTEAITKQIPVWLKDFAFEAIVAFQGFLGRELGDTKLSKDYVSGKSDNAFPDKETTWSDSNSLRNRGGGLLRSFNPKDKDSLTAIKIDGTKLEITIGSKKPYAEIHEKGGAIMDKGNMQNFFWAKFIQSRNPFFKIMALSVAKRGGVRIKPRPYFNPALREFTEVYITKWLFSIFDKIVKALV